MYTERLDAKYNIGKSGSVTKFIEQEQGET